MSGTNRTVMSDVVMKNGSESTLTRALENANKEAVALDPQGKTKRK